MKIIFHVFLLGVSIFLIFFSTHLYSTGVFVDLPNPELLLIVMHLFFVITSLYLSIFIFRRYIISSNASERFKNYSTSLFMMVVIFFLLEGIFTLIPKSNANSGLSEITWMLYYWEPINNQGYRDKNFRNDHPNKKIIACVGDSFTAGWGIKNIENRYSNILENELHDRFKVINLGKNGSDTKRELAIIKKVNIKIDVLIIQYFINDINDIALRQMKNYSFDRSSGKLPFLIRVPIETSFLFNYLYWLFPSSDHSYVNFVKEAFKNPQVLTEQLKEIQDVVDYCNLYKIKPIFVLFPELASLEIADLTPIIQYMSQHNIKFIDVTELVRDIPVENRVVNAIDSHPSERVNRVVAETIKQTILANAW